MAIKVTVIQLVVNLLTTCMHFIASYALIKILPTSRIKPQRLYLLNLSIVETIYNLLEFVRGLNDVIMAAQIEGPGATGNVTNVSNVTNVPPTLPTTNSIPLMTTVMEYEMIVSWIGVAFVFYLAMIWIPLDRLALIYLNVRYTSVWDAQKAKRHIIASWCFGLLFGIVMCVVYKVTAFQVT